MDFGQLESELRSIERKPEKVRDIVEYILINTSENELEVAKVIENEFHNLSSEKQLAIFYVVSEILLVSNKKHNINFFKALANKVKSFLEALSKSITNIQDMKDICRILDKWASDEMLAPNFMEKLKHVVKHFYVRIADNLEEAKKQGFKKYKKTFLMQVNDIRKYPVSTEIYDDICIYKELESKATSLNSEFSKLDLSGQSEDTTKRCKELLKIYNDLSERMEKLLNRINKNFLGLREWTKEEYQLFKESL